MHAATHHGVRRTGAVTLTVALILATLAAVAPTAAHADQRTFTATVTAEDTGEPLPGIRVIIGWDTDDGGSFGDEVLTDLAGSFSITVDVATEYRLMLNDDGGLFFGDEVTIDGTGDGDIVTNLTLTRGARIQGLVIDDRDRTPLRGLEPRVWNPDQWPPDLFMSTTDADGAFFSRSPAISGQTYRIGVTSPEGVRTHNVVGSNIITAPQDNLLIRVRPIGWSADTFDDVGRSHPFADEISWMIDREITGGFNDGTFRPTQAVTRQAAAAFLYRLAGEPEVTTQAGFSDVPTNHPFHDEIAWMVAEGITQGFNDNTFRPTQAVSRQAAAAFLYRQAGEPTVSIVDTPQTDVPEGHPFFDAITWMVENSYASGFDDGTFRPTNPVTRQAMSAFLFRLNPPFVGGDGGF